MIEIDFDRLRPIGLSSVQAQALAALDHERGVAARVVAVFRETVVVHDGTREFSVRPLPRLVRELVEEDSQLAVGDWVLVEGDAWAAVRVPPANQITRRDPGGERHIIASNIDVALVLMGLDDDFNPRRVERYLATVQAARVWPVVVLTKADLSTRDLDPSARASQIHALRERLPSDVLMHSVDATAPQAAATLAPYLGVGQTVVLLGSSGAGKSTLTNTLAGNCVQATGPVRENDGRGRHTTTSRVLIVLPGGACVIDTPGLRGLRPDADASAIAATFADIGALASACRFRDCRHQAEPGCAVQEAVGADRLANYHKLQREVRRDQMDSLARRQLQAQMKVRARAMRARLKEKG